MAQLLVASKQKYKLGGSLTGLQTQKERDRETMFLLYHSLLNKKYASGLNFLIALPRIERKVIRSYLNNGIEMVGI